MKNHVSTVKIDVKNRKCKHKAKYTNNNNNNNNNNNHKHNMYVRSTLAICIFLAKSCCFNESTSFLVVSTLDLAYLIIMKNNE